MSIRWRTVLAVDHCPRACEVYRANVPECERVECGDVGPLVAAMPAADVILGGPPCQPYSLAGKGLGTSDARDCVPDFCAAVEAVRPRMFLMEEVAAFAELEKFQPVLRSTFARLSRAGDDGYDVQMRVLDAVDFGVPQFRRRAWLWGIRRDLVDVIRRRRWPMRTHVDPATLPETGMFGPGFGPRELPWVTVGQALGLDGEIRRPRQTGAREVVGVGEPSSTIGATRADEHYSIRRARSASVVRRDHPACEPCPTITNGGDGSGGILRIKSHADPARVISEPASTLRSGGDGHDGCRVELYRWSDAMLEKHPPATPATPAPTVQAKWAKGDAEGLISAQGAASPSPTIVGGAKDTGGPEPVFNRTRAGFVRRLTPDECARLQSLPDSFVWPAAVAKTHRYRIIGNGWASLMAKRMSEALRAADPDAVTVVDLFCGGGCGAVGWHGRAWEYDAEATTSGRGCA